MPPENISPIQLDDIERAGATRFGREVSRVVLLMKDGRKLSVDLPTGAADLPDELTPTQRRIVDILAASVKPMTRKAVASKLKVKSTRGGFARCFQVLLEQGYIHHQAGEYSDDEKKFTASV